MESTLSKLIGQNIRAIRFQYNLTQVQFAQRIGFSASSISNIEKGYQSIYLIDLYKIADSFNIDIYDLLPSLKELKAATPTIKKEMNKLTSEEKYIVDDIVNLLKQIISEEAATSDAKKSVRDKGGKKIS